MQCGLGLQGSGVPAGRGWSTLGSCGFTSLSLTRRGICFFSVEFCNFSSEPRGGVLSHSPSKPGCPSSAPVWWNPSLPLPTTPAHQLHLFAPGKGVVWKWQSVWGHFLCGAFGFSGSSLGPSWPCTSPASPQTMRIHGTTTWVGVYLLPGDAPCPNPPQNIQQCKDWPSRGSSTLCQLLGQPQAIALVESFGWVGEFSCSGPHWRRGDEAFPRHPPPFPTSPTAHEVSLANQMYTC